MSTKITTGTVRLSYCNLFEAKASEAGGEAKYSVQLLIPKSDTVTVGKIKAAIAEAAKMFRLKNGENSLPANPLSPLHDGDGEKPNGGEYGPECKGHYVMSASSKLPPRVFDRNRQEIIDQNEIYSGCYGQAVVNFYGYNNRRKGVGCGLLGVRKMADGDPFGMVATADDFTDDMGAAGEDDDFMS